MAEVLGVAAVVTVGTNSENKQLCAGIVRNCLQCWVPAVTFIFVLCSFLRGARTLNPKVFAGVEKERH